MDEFILATTTAKEDDQLEIIAKEQGFKVVREVKKMFWEDLKVQ